MALIDNIDGSNRLINLSEDTKDTSINPIDIYKEMRTLRKDKEELRKFDVFMKAYGKVPKSSTTFTERYVVLQGGCKIVPYNETHTLTITGTVITDDGKEGVACFDKSSLSDGVVVDISYIPKQVEIIIINSGSGLSQAESDKLMATPTAEQNADAVWDKEL